MNALEPTIDAIRPILNSFIEKRGSLIGLLQDIHETYGYLPEEILREVSQELDVPLGKFYSLATFYTSFRLEPMGKHHICTCVGTACHVKGAPAIVDTFKRELNIQEGETTADGTFTLDTVNCLGACALAPLIVVDGEYYGKSKPNKVSKLIEQYKNETE